MKKINSKISIQVCKRSNEKYQSIRDRHYIPNNGCHGQQIHFLVKLNDEVVGIISGASSVYGVKDRDNFFNFPDDRETINSYYLPAIISNNVFRLETHKRNLGTMVLKLWRESIKFLWEKAYQVPVIGFETFIIENDRRKGAMYKADNWSFVGETVGSTKSHNGLENPAVRKKTCPKLIYCRWEDMDEKVPQVEYQSSWRRETLEEKKKYKHTKKHKEKMLGLEIFRGDRIEEKYNKLDKKLNLF